MNVESVRLKRTLKAGKDIWLEGTVFPNKNCPLIPSEILGEALAGRPTVEVIERQEDDIHVRTIESSKPVFKDGPTNVSSNVMTSGFQEGDIDGKREIQSPINNAGNEKPVKVGLVRRG